MTDFAAPEAQRGGHSRKRLFWVILTSIMIASATVTALLFTFFLLLGSTVQLVLNFVCFCCYIVILWLLKHRYNKPALVLIWVAAFGQAAIGTLLTGWDSGYYCYLVMFIPTIIVSTTRRPACLMLAGVWCFSVGLFLVMRFVPPLQPISYWSLGALQGFNLSIVFVMISYFVFMYHALATKSEQKLNRLATTDSLTGLFNRRHAREIALRDVALFDRGSRALSYILADIDHFKSINDRLGHQAGDTVLVAVSEALRSVTRGEDILARWGGEEFLFILPGTPRMGAAELANRVRDVVAGLEPIPGMGPITLTFGISSQRKGETFDAAILRADKALYAGKSAGRNCVMLEPEDDAMPRPEQAAD